MLLTALLPLVVVLGLGYLAGWRHDFSGDGATVLNRMVMTYALPLSLFAGLAATPRERLFGDGPLLLWIAVGMGGGLAVVALALRWLLRVPAPLAVLRALAVAGPAVPFVGPGVLGTLFHADAPVAISVGALVMNVVQVPVAVMVLAGAKGQTGPGSAWRTLGRQFRSTVAEPIVWAPLAALALVLAGVRLPAAAHASLTLLGQATGGVALFASGITLWAQKVSLSGWVWTMAAAKNLALPALVWGAMALAGASPHVSELAVVTLALPTAAIPTILAIQYKVGAREMASTLFLSTATSVLSLAGFILLT
jgi:predicted permease